MISRMFDYLATTVRLFVSSSIQLALGSAVALIVSWTVAGKRRRAFAGDGAATASSGTGFGRALIGSATAAFCGAALPLGIFGALPIAMAALALGTGAELILGFLTSNLLFNTLVPFTDPFFIWRTGYPRAILAVAAGIASALVVGHLKGSGRGLLRDRPLPEAPAWAIAAPSAPSPSAPAPFGKSGAGVALRYLLASLAETWPYAAAGALIGTAFLSYGLGAIMNFMFTNPLTQALPYVFAQADVTNPFFILATRILMTLTDFSSLAALAAVLKVRGIVAFFVYFGLLAVLLGTTAFV
jgi:hypothetical protein